MLPLLRSIQLVTPMLSLPKLLLIAIRETEVEKIREFFLKRKIDLKIIDQSTIKTLYSDKLIEISFPII